MKSFLSYLFWILPLLGFFFLDWYYVIVFYNLLLVFSSFQIFLRNRDSIDREKYTRIFLLSLSCILTSFIGFILVIQTVQRIKNYKSLTDECSFLQEVLGKENITEVDFFSIQDVHEIKLLFGEGLIDFYEVVTVDYLGVFMSRNHYSELNPLNETSLLRFVDFMEDRDLQEDLHNLYSSTNDNFYYDKFVSKNISIIKKIDVLEKIIENVRTNIDRSGNTFLNDSIWDMWEEEVGVFNDINKNTQHFGYYYNNTKVEKLLTESRGEPKLKFFYSLRE